MKWFIKVLRHYADFSGRARRKEYWMFALFNVIFLFAWMFLTVFVFAFINRESLREEQLNAATLFSYWNYLILILLPGMAVAVRRLHDVGKSGWMLLVGLIPIIGGIWLLILMLTSGQQGNNRYGPDPKTSAESFGQQARLKSAGLTLVIASVLSIVANVFNFFVPFDSYIYFIIIFIASILLLIAGILLMNKRAALRMEGTTKNAMLLLAVAMIILLIKNIFWFVRFGAITGMSILWQFKIFYAITAITNLSVGLFAAFHLFSPQRKDLIRYAGLCAVIFAVPAIFMYIYNSMFVTSYIMGATFNNSLQNFLDLPLGVLAYILLIYAFFSKKEEQPAVALAPEAIPQYASSEKNVYQSSGQPANAEPLPEDNAGKSSIGWKIFGLIVSIGLIIGGMSGELVLRGTDSSTALVVVGVILLIFNIISLATHNRNKEKREEKRKEYEKSMSEGTIDSVQLAVPATIKVIRESSIVGAIVSYKVYLNHEFIGYIKNGNSMEISTSVSHNIITVFDNNDNPFKGEFVAKLEEGGYAEVRVKAGRFVKD